jgi:hypothetical protein
MTEDERWTPVHRQNASELNFAPTPATIHRMLELLIVVVRALTLALRGYDIDVGGLAVGSA